MASVMLMHADDTVTDIDYSVIDGRVREFTYHGNLLFDENDTATADPKWEEVLIEQIQAARLNVDSFRGVHAFVRALAEQGKLQIVEPQ